MFRLGLRVSHNSGYLFGVFIKRITYSIFGSILECPYLGKLPDRESSGKDKDVQGEFNVQVVI